METTGRTHTFLCAQVASTLTESVRMSERPQAIGGRASPKTEDIEMQASHPCAVIDYLLCPLTSEIEETIEDAP